MTWLEVTDWYLRHRKYLYRDALSATFIRSYDCILKKYIFEFIPSEFDIGLVERVAEEKSRHTNDEDQYDNIRDPIRKKNKQFEGCLAELAVAKFLIDIFGEKSENVHIYDAERMDFKYRVGEEYDVKVIRSGVEKKCEIRNSWSYKTTLTQFCSGYGDIIGTYTHESKYEEELADFYFRPVLQLHKPDADLKYPPGNAISLVKSGSAKLFIVAACTKEQMITLGDRNSRMDKNQTKYWTTKIDKLNSVDSFKDLYNNLFEE